MCLCIVSFVNSVSYVVLNTVVICFCYCSTWSTFCPKMSKRGVVLHGRAREIICNVDKYFESEKQRHLELMQQLKVASILSGPEGNITLGRDTYAAILQTLQNTSKVAERVNLATGINKNTLTRIRREKRDAQASCSKMMTPKKKARATMDLPEPLLEVSVKCEIIDNSDEEVNLDGHPKKRRIKEEPDLSNRVKCELCPKDFDSQYQMKKHMETHTGERPYLCTESGKTDTQLGHLYIQDLKHVECGASFYRKADLDEHEKFHTGVKPYACEFCSKSFVQKNNFVMHVKMHTGDRRFECEVCQKKFITRSKMLLHSKRHEEDKKVKKVFDSDEGTQDREDTEYDSVTVLTIEKGVAIKYL